MAGLEGAGIALSPLIKKLGLEGHLRLRDIRLKWNELFPGPLSRHTSPAAFKDKRHLIVHVDSSAWLQQTSFLKSMILEKLKPIGISDVRFMLGRLSIEHEEASAGPQDPDLPLTDEDRTFIEQCVSRLHDPELRETVRRTIGKSLSRPRNKKQ